jgi:hypothetical protein
MMNRYFLTNVFMVACCAYVVYAIGNYQLLANTSDWVAAITTIVAMVLGGLGVMGMITTTKEYFKSK